MNNSRFVDEGKPHMAAASRNRRRPMENIQWQVDRHCQVTSYRREVTNG